MRRRALSNLQLLFGNPPSLPDRFEMLKPTWFWWLVHVTIPTFGEFVDSELSHSKRKWHDFAFLCLAFVTLQDSLRSSFRKHGDTIECPK